MKTRVLLGRAEDFQSLRHGSPHPLTRGGHLVGCGDVVVEAGLVYVEVEVSGADHAAQVQRLFGASGHVNSLGPDDITCK